MPWRSATARNAFERVFLERRKGAIARRVVGIYRAGFEMFLSKPPRMPRASRPGMGASLLRRSKRVDAARPADKTPVHSVGPALKSSPSPSEVRALEPIQNPPRRLGIADSSVELLWVDTALPPAEPLDGTFLQIIQRQSVRDRTGAASRRCNSPWPRKVAQPLVLGDRRAPWRLLSRFLVGPHDPRTWATPDRRVERPIEQTCFGVFEM